MKKVRLIFLLLLAFIGLSINVNAQTTTDCPQQVYDAVNNIIYNVVELAGRCWLKENVSATKYQDGTDVPFARPYYHSENPNTEQNAANFGLLYDWYSAFPEQPGPMLRSLCPYGWRIPTIDEFDLLKAFSDNDLRNPDFWLPMNNGYTNSTGFDMRGAGFYNSEKDRFDALYGYTAYWTYIYCTPFDETQLAITMLYYCSELETTEITKADAISVRCIQE